jgi:7-carboxy-7-deazaguanine synthase
MMFGKNRIEKQEHSDGKHLRIVKGSPWLTIQGEGPYAGRAAVFIRLHGCNLACTWCDTNFDDPDNPVIRIDTILDLVCINRGLATLVVITGGEPMRQNILPLCEMLTTAGFQVQIETAGTLWIPGIEQHSNIVCSPKTPTIHPMVHKHAMAFKYVVRATDRFDDEITESFIPITATQHGTRVARLATPRAGARVYVSPCNEYDAAKNRNNLKLVAHLAMKYNIIAGIQMHQYLEVP